MELLQLEHFGKILRLEGSLAGWQELYWGDSLVSQLSATENRAAKSSHHFELYNQVPQAVESEEQQPAIKCQLAIDLSWQPFAIEYQLMIDGSVVERGSRNSKDIEQQVPIKKVQVKKKVSSVGLFSLAIKLFKSAKLVKVILAGASLAAYSWFFSWQFALSLVGCLVFHEYGHIRAMQYFSMKTKGIYLIPFFGGLAVSDDKINTRWQDVVISIMGPTFGLLMSIASLLLYWSTDITFFAGLAVFNSLLNLFNLLPILPLDGGHILKSISFSINSKLGLVACLLAAALGVLVSYSLGLALLGFLLLIGSVEIMIEWRGRHQSHLLPLDRYGQIFSTAWYLLTVGAFVAIIVYFADSPEQILALPMKILGS